MVTSKNESVKISKEQVSRTYNLYAYVYDIIFGANLNQGRKRVIKMMNTRPADNILEIGIGTGISLRYYDPNQRITGIDLSPKMLEKAQKRVKKYNHKQTILKTLNAESLDMADESFDKVVIMYVYSVTPNPNILLKEAMRVCRSNGDIYIVNHFSNYDGSSLTLSERLLKKYAPFIGFRSSFSYQEFITDLNLNIQKVEPINFMGLSRIVHFKKS